MSSLNDVKQWLLNQLESKTDEVLKITNKFFKKLIEPGFEELAEENGLQSYFLPDLLIPYLEFINYHSDSSRDNNGPVMDEIRNVVCLVMDKMCQKTPVFYNVYMSKMCHRAFRHITIGLDEYNYEHALDLLGRPSEVINNWRYHQNLFRDLTEVMLTCKLCKNWWAKNVKGSNFTKSPVILVCLILDCVRMICSAHYLPSHEISGMSVKSLLTRLNCRFKGTALARIHSWLMLFVSLNQTDKSSVVGIFSRLNFDLMNEIDFENIHTFPINKFTTSRCISKSCPLRNNQKIRDTISDYVSFLNDYVCATNNKHRLPLYALQKVNGYENWLREESGKVVLNRGKNRSIESKKRLSTVCDSNAAAKKRARVDDNQTTSVDDNQATSVDDAPQTSVDDAPQTSVDDDNHTSVDDAQYAVDCEHVTPPISPTNVLAENDILSTALLQSGVVFTPPPVTT